MTGGERTPVAVLGATGAVGQRLVRLLAGHPWLRPAELIASDSSAGSTYGEAVDWILEGAVPEEVRRRPVRPLGEEVASDLVFSALPSGVAGPAEEQHAGAGKLVVTNARDHRMDPDVPLIVPEVNPGHLALAEGQAHPEGGAVVANPNCTTIGLVLALKPLVDAFGVREVQVVTMQALSGAGHPGVSALDIQDNVVPHIPGEEEKLGREPHKILGELRTVAEDGSPGLRPAELRVSAQCNRVAVLDGHLQSVSVRLAADPPPSTERVRRAWEEFRGRPQELDLPTAPERPVRYLDGPAAPQPRLHRGEGEGMTVTVGRLERCPVLDLRFVTLSHNTVRGAAGGALLTAELALSRREVGEGPGAGRARETGAPS